MQDSSIPMPSRTLRYSGSERPACRMNQTGVWDGTSPRAAARKGLSASPGWGVGTASVTRESSQVRRRGGTSAEPGAGLL